MSLIDKLVARFQDYEPRSIEEDMPEAGILVPVTRNARHPEIIFTRRSQSLSTHKGQVAFPGGKFDLSDKIIENTALRECHEEIGIKPEDVEIVSPLSHVVSLHGIRVSPFVGLVPEDVELTPNPAELDRVFKVPVEYFLTTEPTRRDKMTYKGIALSVPSYEYHDLGETYQIWGLSAIVVVELMNQAFDADITIFDDYERSRL
jgi:8-oxo-dGTP pyrophosphatase MutT (NUDIX family)